MLFGFSLRQLCLFTASYGYSPVSRAFAQADSSENPPALWAVKDEEEKAGSGILLFAYGDTAELGHFLGEAVEAARSLKAQNPTLSIAIVTNNETVDRTLFDYHILPRRDLLFPGKVCSDSCRHDNLMRQWTTRIYYMAHSPFRASCANAPHSP